MEQLIGILIDRLVRKGMEISTIPAYVRDVANTIAANRLLTIRELNRRVQLLGWNDFDLDDYTLCLIIAAFEPDSAYKPPYWFDRTFNPQGIYESADEKRPCTNPLDNPQQPIKE